MTTTNDPDEIRREIERTRAELSDDVDGDTKKNWLDRKANRENFKDRTKGTGDICGDKKPNFLDPATEDAPPAARLREDGAIVFAKTTMPDYGMLSSGLSSFHPLAS